MIFFKNKYLNILILFFASCCIFQINSNEYFIIRLFIKTLLLGVVCICLYYAYISKAFNSSVLLAFGTFAIFGLFFDSTASKKVFGKWSYSDNITLGFDYVMEIKEDSSFIWREISQKTGRILYEKTTGFIKAIKNGKGISKDHTLIEFKLLNSNTKKYLVFDGLKLSPPPYDADYGTYDYFPFTPVNNFKGYWERE